MVPDPAASRADSGTEVGTGVEMKRDPAATSSSVALTSTDTPSARVEASSRRVRFRTRAFAAVLAVSDALLPVRRGQAVRRLSKTPAATATLWETSAP